MADVSLALAAYGLDPGSCLVERPSTGLIHDTHVVTLADGRRLVAQRISERFCPEYFLARMVADADAVTRHLEAAGIATLRLVPTPAGALFARTGDGYWRLSTYVPGTTHTRIDRPAMAASAGVLLGRVHVALETLDHAFQWACIGLHDTASYLERLRAALDRASPEIRAVGGEILVAADHRLDVTPLPARIGHGDPKVANLRFDGDEAIALVDLDTAGRHPIAHELGDALRSWCNPAPEDDASGTLDPTLFEAAVRGYAAAARGLLTAEEVASIVPGVQLVAVELAARFCLDAVEQTHFAWDRSRFATCADANLARARGQLAVACTVSSRRGALEATVARVFDGRVHEL